jgi:hypothetical protein
MSQLAPTPVFRGVDAFGFPLYLGQLGTFVAGTNTPQVTYKDSLQIATNTNPVILNPRGECNLWLDPTKAYKFVLSDALGNLIWTVDNITIGNANPSFNLIPTVDNLFTLGSPTFSFANLYLGVNHAPALDTVTGNIGYYARTAAEIALSITPVAFSYPPGHVYRYGTNTVPGTTDMTAVINTTANVCRQGGYVLQLPMDGKLLVSASLNFSGCRVQGLGNAFNSTAGIQATNAQFDVITSTGFTTMDSVWVDGGWNGATAGLTGDILSLKAISPAHPYLNSFSNCNFQNAKARGIYIERGGYTSLYHMHVLGCGLHGLECFGLNTDACTSITDSGGSQYGSTPYGYGIKLTECTQIGFYSTICEATCGLQFNGADNRLWTFERIYQEFQPTPSFTAKIDNGSGGAGTTLTVTAPAMLAGLGVGSQLTGAGIAANTFITATGTGTGGIGTYTVNNSQLVLNEAMTASILYVVDNSGGVGLIFRGCFGIGATMPFTPSTAAFQNWTGVYFQGNNGMSDGPIPLAGRIQTNGNGTNTVTVTSDVTAGQLTLSPGTYRLWGAVQTIVSSGGGTLTQLACQITTSSVASGLNNSLPITEAAAQTSSIGTNQDARVNCFTEVQVFAGAAVTYYLRAHIVLSGTITEAYSGLLRAELIE